MPKLSVCTFNILAQSYIRHNIREGRARAFCEWSYREPLLQNFIETQLQTMIIGCQEAETKVIKGFEKCLPRHQFFYSQRSKSPDGLLLMLHEACQVQSFRAIPLCNEKNIERRIAQIVDCKVQEQEFRLVNLHLDYDGRDRKDGFLQLQQICAVLISLVPRPTLLFGDFNITANSRTFQTIIKNGFSAVDTSLATCYTSRWSRVDHVFYSPKFQMNEIQILKISEEPIPNENWGSDHIPIFCQFQILG